ncbi:MAG TPA: 16S rRNA (cytosine(967)-C(5))-methyltransferase RsmB [Chthoniobacterales bacterium]|nr:16S rRNA (cytosine(967)-C(5))-methyltransferase RsmB [Chthoniobacterales bacterium]
MAQTSARGVALAALRSWRNKNLFADAVISQALAKASLSSADRAFALELFYGVLRNLTLLDFWIRNLRPTRVEVDLRDVLRLGLYQLFVIGTAEHAAVNETVGLVPKAQRAIVNAILRSAVRERPTLRDQANAQPLEIRTSHPKFLIERWQKQFGAKATQTLCEWNNQPPLIYARINQLKIDRQTFLERYRDARPVANTSNFVELPSPSAALAAGNCYVQDPSTAIACDLLAPQPGEKILDACAAPGGKTSYLAEPMQNRGLILACDRDPDRLRLLDENLTRLAVQIAKIVQQDWTTNSIVPEILSAAPFDRILVDAPCSNTGVMRRRVDVRWRLKPTDFARMQVRQIEIVRAITPLLKKDGVIVYSTCSLEREENEEVVRELADSMSILRLEEEKFSLPFRDNFDGAYAAKMRRIA